MTSRTVGRRPFILSLVRGAASFGGAASLGGAALGGCGTPPRMPEAPPAPPSEPTLDRGELDVRSFGADPSGATDSSAAFRNAIAAAEKQGGGTIVIPTGTYSTGPLRFVSNLTLRFSAGAELRFSSRFDDYLPMVRSRWEGTMVRNFSPLLAAEGAHDLTLEGPGVIDGNGSAWWKFFEDLKLKKERDGVWDTSSKWQREFIQNNPNLEFPDDPDRLRMGFLRPPLLQFLDCKNVSIREVTFRNAPFWTVNPVFCENVTIHGVTVENPEEAPNTDGINPESCRNVHISDCHLDVGDDCITIKSGRDAEARRMARPAENYTITNCTMLHGHGGVVIGSEMSGGVRRIAISNCVFDGTDRGIRLKSTRGRGGVVEDVTVSNVVMKDVRIEAITLDLFYTEAPPEPVSERTPNFRNIHFSGVRGTAEHAAMLKGLPELPLENISFHDVELRAKQGISIRDARSVRLRGVRVETLSGSPLSADSVSDLDVFAFGGRSEQQGVPTISLVKTRSVYVHGCSASAGVASFVHVGEGSTGIVIEGNHLGAAALAVTRDASVSPRAIESDEKVVQR